MKMCLEKMRKKGSALVFPGGDRGQENKELVHVYKSLNATYRVIVAVVMSRKVWRAKGGVKERNIYKEKKTRSREACERRAEVSGDETN